MRPSLNPKLFNSASKMPNVELCRAKLNSAGMAAEYRTSALQVRSKVRNGPTLVEVRALADYLATEM